LDIDKLTIKMADGEHPDVLFDDGKEEVPSKKDQT
jgi:hypothetical protein